MNIFLRGLVGRVAHADTNRAETQRVHHRNRSGAHGENVPQNSAHTSGRALERFNKRRVVVRFDLESTGPAIADIDDARVLSWTLEYAFAACRQAFQMHARRFVRAMLAPHHAEDAKFG